MGGAMDLVSGVHRVIVLTDHSAQDGSAKLVRECTLPLTGVRVVTRVITDLCVLDITSSGFEVIELAPDVSRDLVERQTGAPVSFCEALR
jgi:3-oxoacid CoA-transferase subunit B